MAVAVAVDRISAEMMVAVIETGVIVVVDESIKLIGHYSNC